MSHDTEPWATPIAGRGTDMRDNGRGERGLWKAIAEIERSQGTILYKLGQLTTSIEKDQAERRSLSWAKLPVWLGVLAWCALAAVEVWARLHG